MEKVVSSVWLYIKTNDTVSDKGKWHLRSCGQPDCWVGPWWAYVIFLNAHPSDAPKIWRQCPVVQQLEYFPLPTSACQYGACRLLLWVTARLLERTAEMARDLSSFLLSLKTYPSLSRGCAPAEGESRYSDGLTMYSISCSLLNFFSPFFL